MKFKNLLLTTILVFASASAMASYTDGESYIISKNKGNWTDIDAMKKALVEAFDSQCGDSWCEGNYGNLTSMGFDCSVDDASGQILSCVWAFAGTNALVNDQTGIIQTDQTVRFCKIEPKMKMAELIETVIKTNEKNWMDTLDLQLPGMNKSLIEVLNDCL